MIETMASRMLRPFIGSQDYLTVSNSMAFGLRTWLFPTWRPFRQSPWMILSREAVTHFRTDRKTLNFLAFLEHSFVPDESFYATALMNSPLSNRLQGDKRRYNREPGNGATTWVGWPDRHIFPPGQTEPRYLFFRPFNALGTTYDEHKLRNHLEMLSGSECIVGQMGYREECLRAFAEKVAIDNHVVLVPVNKAFTSLASNLRCSLARIGWTNVLHWALDLETHGISYILCKQSVSHHHNVAEELLEAGHLSIFLPGGPNEPSLVLPGSRGMKSLMSLKPTILLQLLNAGFHVWALDADTVVLGNFLEEAVKFVKEPYQADVMVAMDERAQIHSPSGESQGKNNLPALDSGTLYLRNTVGTKRFLEKLQKSRLDEKAALNARAQDSRSVLITGFGTSGDHLYPSSSTSQNSDESLRKSPEKQSPSGLSSLFASYVTDSMAPTQETKTRLHVLDQLHFVSGNLLYSGSLTQGYSGHKIIHVGRSKDDPEKALRLQGFWFVDLQGVCLKAPKGATS